METANKTLIAESASVNQRHKEVQDLLRAAEERETELTATIQRNEDTHRKMLKEAKVRGVD